LVKTLAGSANEEWSRMGSRIGCRGSHADALSGNGPAASTGAAHLASGQPAVIVGSLRGPPLAGDWSVLIGRQPFDGYGLAILGSAFVALIPITVRIPIVVAGIRVSIVVGMGVTIITIVVVVVVWCRSNGTAEQTKAEPEADRGANAPAATATMVPTAAVTPSPTMPTPSAAVGKGWNRRICQ